MSTFRARPGRASCDISPRTALTRSTRVACSAGASPKKTVETIAPPRETPRRASPRRARRCERLLRDLRRHGARHRIDRRLEDDARDDEAERRGRERKQQAFREQLPDDASAGGAEREPDADLTLARDRTRQQEVGDVRAADHQDQAEDKEERREHQQQPPPAEGRFPASARAMMFGAGGRLRFRAVRPRIPHREPGQCRLARHPRLQPADDLDGDGVSLPCMNRPELAERAKAAPNSRGR